ncbi:MAG: pyridoxal-phosphate dependent enzyme [Spirochaetaceae bacterium]|nr:pyridoxal-phosphate dependent enzyme [Spirochaetaceae bacterium]
MAQRQTTQRTAAGSGFGTTAADLPTVADLHAAAERIGPYVHRTPVFTNSYLDAESGARLFFKAENLQKVGAFKMRGAANFVLQLSAAEARRGVVTHSSGNHGQAVAAAARARGVPATVVMPRSSSAVKRAAVAGYGAHVVLCEDGDAARAAAAGRIEAEQGATLIHPYGHPRIVAGQGTLALELFEQVAALDTVVAPVGGGGCLSGISVAARARHPELAVYGAEPAAADDAARSLAAGHIIPVEQPDTVADGLRTSLVQLTFALLRGNGVAILTVEEADIIAAMRLIWTRMKLVVEPSAAVTLAAVLAHPEPFRGRRVGLVLTGGNVDLDHLPWLQG